MSKFHTAFLLSLFMLSMSAWGAYNEVFDKNGHMRPAYKEYQRRTGVKLYPVQDETVQAMMNAPLKDSIQILPIPLVLTEDDYETLQAGALQRQRALHAFFADVIFNEGRTIIGAKILDDKIIRELFSIADDHHSLDYLRDIWKNRTANDVNYMMGSDIVRNEKGEFVVLEDNVGNMGGVGDLAATHTAMDRHFQKDPSVNYKTPFENAIREFLSDIPKKDWKSQVLAVYDSEDPSANSEQIKMTDQESMRKVAILKKMGVPVVSVHTFAQKETRMRVHGFQKGAPAVKKIINFYDLALAGLSSDQAFLLHSTFKDKKIDMLTPPGVSILSNKAFLPLIEIFIRTYLGEKPLLKTQHTEWVKGLATDEVQKPGWVIKKANGEQGEEVYITDHMQPVYLKNLKATVQNWAAFSMMKSTLMRPHYVRQKVLDPSYIPSTADAKTSWVKFNVDFRPHIFVLGNKASIPAIWGRASFKLPGILNNVSQGAFEVVVKSASGNCEGLLLKKLNPK